jgi:hypothetical protein
MNDDVRESLTDILIFAGIIILGIIATIIF